MVEQILACAPPFELASVTAGPVGLPALTADGPVALVFVAQECPTSALALARLSPAVTLLGQLGVTVAAIFEDPVEVAARVARRAGFDGVVLSEPPPYDTSRAYELQSLPTIVLVDRRQRIAALVVGWDVDAVNELLALACAEVDAPAPQLGDQAPTRKPGCAAKSTYDAATLALLDGAGAVDELEEMFDRGWTDGLPVAPPTRERVQRMLGGRDGEQSLGEIAPSTAEVTLARVASCAVLAGCRPDYFPVVLAAVRAALAPEFNLGGQAVTTQPAGQLVVVSGPVAEAIGVNAGVGALGPGWRANLTIGRALRLVVALTGGGFPGGLDRATLGNPGKIGLCVAEDERCSPWEPLHVERGFDREQSVVTVIGCDAPLSISDHRSTSAPELARVLGWAAAATWSPNWWPLGGTSVFVICPEHARMFAAAGWSKQRLREELSEVVKRPAGELRWGETTPEVHRAADSQWIGKWSRPDDIVLIVAGGEAGRYSAVFGPCLGMDTVPVSREVSWTT